MSLKLGPLTGAFPPGHGDHPWTYFFKGESNKLPAPGWRGRAALLTEARFTVGLTLAPRQL